MTVQVTPVSTSVPLRLWTVEEYHRLAEAGILTGDEPVELVGGQIIRKMSPQKTPHATALTLTRLLLEHKGGKEVLVRTQLPVSLGEQSEPEPDVAVVMPDALRYLPHHPLPEEIFLIVEIADTTLKIDCGLKAKDYAIAGIADYWVLEIKKRQLRVFREPTPTGYQRKRILGEGETISPLRFPNWIVEVARMLPP